MLGQESDLKRSSSSKILLAIAAVTSAAFLTSPTLAQQDDASPSGVAAATASAASPCTVGVIVAANFDYDLQSIWGGAAGIIGQALADEANRDKLQERRNELELALPPEALFEIITKSDLQKVGIAPGSHFLPLRRDGSADMLVKTKTSIFRDSGDCHYELYVTRISASKTIMYGTFLDTKFNIKKYSGGKIVYTYKDTIRRKISNFPASAESDVTPSRLGVQEIFRQQWEYFLGKVKL